MNKMINRLLMTLLGLSFSMMVLSQENFVSGYIIKINGDTLKGFVDYRNWAKNPTQIRFKEGSSSEIMKYKPTQISAFGALDEIYKSAIVKVDSSNTKERISISPAFEFRTDTVFLQTLFQGSKSLYYYKDRYDQMNFYIFNNSQYELLEFKKYIRRDKDQHEFQGMNMRFVGQLRLYFQDCPGVETMLKDLAYDNKSLQKVYQYYYDKTQTRTHMSRTNEKIRTEFGVVGGAGLIHLKFTSGATSQTFDYLTKATFKNNLSLAGGLFMNVVIPRNNGKWSIYNELYFSSDISSGQYTNFNNAECYQKHEMNIGAYYVKINNMVRFKYPVSKWFCFVNAGISNGLALKVINTDHQEDRFYTQNTITDVKALDDTENLEQGLLFGFGVINHKISMEIRYEGGTGMSAYPLLSSNAQRFSLLVGYKF
ncbi:MAG: hypothetical protein PHT07_01715 [Paludibacter sp.]|nr:hypothetical protein [Paludibacter sp.]